MFRFLCADVPLNALITVWVEVSDGGWKNLCLGMDRWRETDLLSIEKEIFFSDADAPYFNIRFVLSDNEDAIHPSSLSAQSYDREASHAMPFLRKRVPKIRPCCVPIVSIALGTEKRVL